MFAIFFTVLNRSWFFCQIISAMSFGVHAGVSSVASTVAGGNDSDFEESRSNHTTIQGWFDESSKSKKTIDSLKTLDGKLAAVLSDHSNPKRLVLAKELLESYSGSDWLLYKRAPVAAGDKPNGYERVLISRHEGLYDLLLLSWSEVSSPIHDHPCERCFLMPLCGAMVEKRYEKTSDGSLKLVHSLPIPNGEASWIDDQIGYHSVGNEGSEIACSLHCYIPGFSRPCTIFDPESNETPSIGGTIRVTSRAATWSVCTGN
jgi:hypothetical protein